MPIPYSWSIFLGQWIYTLFSIKENKRILSCYCIIEIVLSYLIFKKNLYIRVAELLYKKVLKKILHLGHTP